jgi:predicted amidohydrolase YtcJ
VPLDTLITGRIATLAGHRGFGWVEAIGIRDGRVAFAGSEVALETRADPFTERIALEPDEVALPGLTDAHLHLAGAAVAHSQLDLSDAATLDEGMARVGAAHRALGAADTWIEGQGWDSDRWGRWPTAIDLERVAPGRRCALWAHDHHALLVSRAAFAVSAIDHATPDPAGGVILRAADGEPEGVLLESASTLVSVHIPHMSVADLENAIVGVAQDLLTLGVVAVHDPGGVVRDSDLGWSFPAYAHLAETGRLPLRVLASLRPESLDAALEQHLTSGAVLGGDPSGRARVGWQKCFADGSLGSRTAAVRVALDVLEPTARTVPFMPRIEHVQLLDPADRGRFAAGRIAASVQPIHLGSDAAQARRLWGERAESEGYAWASIAATGAVLAFGTDAPVEPYDPWPGIALAVCREDPRWPAGTAPFGADEALTLERAIRSACLDQAVSAHESDRGRLTVGQRADIVVIPTAALREPVEPGGALATARPSIVIMDGRVVFDA